MTEDYTFDLSTQVDMTPHAIADQVVADPRVRRTVAAAARRLAGGGVRQDELEQEIWLEVLQRLHRSYEASRGTAPEFVLGSLRHWARSAWRRLARCEAELPTQDLQEDPSAGTAEAPGGSGADLLGDLLRILPRLDEEDRRLVELRLGGATWAETAAALGTTGRQVRRQWVSVVVEMRALGCRS